MELFLQPCGEMAFGTRYEKRILHYLNINYGTVSINTVFSTTLTPNRIRSNFNPLQMITITYLWCLAIWYKSVLTLLKCTFAVQCP